MKSKLITLLAVIMLMMSSNVAFAGEVEVNSVGNEEAFVSNYEMEELNDNVLPILYSANSMLWSQNYVGQGAVKKRIYTRKYHGDAGTIQVYIKNEGVNPINVTLYRSAFLGTAKIDSAVVPPRNARTFNVLPQHGAYDCTNHNCFYVHDFIVSVFDPTGEYVTFYGSAQTL